MANVAFNTRVNPRLAKRERLSVDGTVRSFTSTNYIVPAAGASGSNAVRGQRIPEAAMLQVFTDEIYWTIDGTDPSSTVGFKSGPGDFIYLNSYQQIVNFKALRVTTTAAVEAQFLFAA